MTLVEKQFPFTVFFPLKNTTDIFEMVRGPEAICVYCIKHLGPPFQPQSKWTLISHGNGHTFCFKDEAFALQVKLKF